MTAFGLCKETVKEYSFQQNIKWPFTFLGYSILTLDDEKHIAKTGEWNILSSHVILFHGFLYWKLTDVLIPGRLIWRRCAKSSVSDFAVSWLLHDVSCLSTVHYRDVSWAMHGRDSTIFSPCWLIRLSTASWFKHIHFNWVAFEQLWSVIFLQGSWGQWLGAVTREGEGIMREADLI